MTPASPAHHAADSAGRGQIAEYLQLEGTFDS
jgi:hypothetical protein